MSEELVRASEAIAAAIARRDVDVLRSWLAPGFTHRSHGGDAVGAEGFLAAVAGILLIVLANRKKPARPAV